MSSPETKPARRYVTSTALYFTDNGRILCGQHCGTAAAYTGVDISGLHIEIVTGADASEWRALTGEPIRCEDCCREFAPESGMAMSTVHGYPYPDALRSLDRFCDTSWGNDVTDSVSFSIGSDAFTIWIEPADPVARSREYGWNPGAPMTHSNEAPFRYTICKLEIETTLDESIASHQPMADEPVFNTDDPAAVVAFIREVQSK